MWGTIPLPPEKCPTSQRNPAPHRSGTLPHFKRNQCPTSTGIRNQTRKAKNGGWERERRVAAKAEHIDGKENPRFVVTSLSQEQWTAQALYEELYCARGDMENRIKEQFSLFADRVSTETMRANQMRLYLSTMAYILVSGLRRLGLKATELAEAQVSTIRTKLLKIGAQIRVTVRKVWVSMASSYPWQDLYRQVWTNLRC
ncbi:MAG TPA: transposase [Terracidiphilus sp.]